MSKASSFMISVFMSHLLHVLYTEGLPKEIRGTIDILFLYKLEIYTIKNLTFIIAIITKIYIHGCKDF